MTINLSSVWLDILIEYSLLVFFEAHKTNAHVKKNIYINQL